MIKYKVTDRVYVVGIGTGVIIKDRPDISGDSIFTVSLDNDGSDFYARDCELKPEFSLSDLRANTILPDPRA